MRIVDYMTADDLDNVRRHYKDIDMIDNTEIDEGDLIIFRLLGARFEYSEVKFKVNPSS